MADQLDTLLSEQRRFPPPAKFAAAANGQAELYQAAERDSEAFWAEQARALVWIRPWDRVLEWKPPHAKWFVGGKLNVSANCLDRHLEGPTRDKAALIWEGEPGDRRVLTYQDLAREVGKAANALKRLGVEKATQISTELCVSVKTVSTYRARIMEKMNMKSNADLTYYAVSQGLLD
jgi:acetyl-CoA synthetase